jgi:DNA-directed RNA polymerase specialized sigma24 family protein
MVQNSILTNDGLILSQMDPAQAERFDGIVDEIAAWLYSLASMLVGEGEASARLVEAAVANTEVSACQDPEQARMSSRQALCEAAVEMLGLRDQNSLAAPEGLKPSGNCIDDDDLEAAEIAREDLQRMIAGEERERVREWLTGLPAAVRTCFVLRAVAGFSVAEIAGLLKAHGGPRAAGWNADAVRSVFREGLCSLASQLLQATAAR